MQSYRNSQKRLRYALGWAKHYEFNNLRVACDTLDTSIEAMNDYGQDNLPPEKGPWDALMTLPGLANNAEKVLLTTRGNDLVSKLLKMQQLEDEDELAYSNVESLDTPREAEADGRPS
ncbi:PREDICTED: dynein heavy chain, cytoplasmic-like [Trachymyrmex septentrionalis]|uniref:dynein heavy chain, cytoplasmic-like n=1 Tax=Trachymyrmex septentrionalis TaxID=34720 RepID=UPI00084F4B32|nr:PREDICTED: dynein heavy chain, cytoplasmic-like [Trachymyrmex septentrionalis]